MYYKVEENLEQLYNEIKQWFEKDVKPYANKWEKEMGVLEDMIDNCAGTGYLGALIPKEYGGVGWNHKAFGLLNEAISTSSVSLAELFNVHTMASQALLKFGNDAQKNYWLPKMAKGEKIAAFALTEPGAGSDMKGIETTFEVFGDKLRINGIKRWITYGNRADVFIVFGKLDGKATACIVEKETEGLNVIKIEGMLGFRGAHLAELKFTNCEIPLENIVGKEGIGFSYVANYGLQFGRLSVAFTALGILRGCIENSSAYALSRKTFSQPLINHDMIKTIIADMGVDFQASAALCLQAAEALDDGSTDSAEKVMSAKYFVSKAAAKHASNAVQILGANGCCDSSEVARYYRDTKILEVVEGSSQIHQMVLGWKFANKYGRELRRNYK